MNTPVPSRDLQAEVARAEQRRCRSLVERDFAALESVLSDQLLYVHSSGRIDGKASLLENVRERVRYQHLEASNASVQLFDGLALWTGTLAATVSVPLDAPALSLRSHVTQLWRLEHGQWRQLLFQATRLPDAAGG
jgi:hypothetical protein